MCKLLKNERVRERGKKKERERKRKKEKERERKRNLPVKERQGTLRSPGYGFSAKNLARF